MAKNIVINGATYPGVDAISAVSDEGEVTMYYPDAVRYVEQELTDAQKEQARKNIDTISQEEVDEQLKPYVKTVNHTKPDKNGNINIEGGSGTESNSFELIPGGTLAWNGNTGGRIIAVNTIDPSLSYVCVSNVIPTLAELQRGGSWASTGVDGVEYEEPFTSENITESGNLINCCEGYILVAKEDGVRYTEGSDIDCTLPKAGVYFAYFGDDGYVSRLVINDYTAFTTSVLKMENLTVHGHDWYGKAVDKGNTARGDDIIHGGLVKVSDAVPTLAEVQKGGMVRRYDVVNNKITGDLIIESYLESPYKIYSQNNEILITSDGIVMVKITSAGVYFRQDSNYCVHSLTIDGYTKFPYNAEKIPADLIPDGIGGGIMRVNFTHEGINESDLTFNNVRADKTFTEIKEHVESGGFAFASVVIDGVALIPISMMPADGGSITFDMVGNGAVLSAYINKDNSAYVEMRMPS